MKDERKECSSPCATCPFLRENFGKPNPEGFDPRTAVAEPGRQLHDWYSEKNLRRLWREGLSRGGVMICHATDPGAASYGGKPAAPGNERPCIGALAVVLRHIKFFEPLVHAGLSPAETSRRYRAAAGRYPMSKEGLFLWAVRINAGRTDLVGGMPIPASLAGKGVEGCGVPWEDPLGNGAAAADEEGGAGEEAEAA